MNIIETNLKFRTALTNRNSTNRIIIHHAEASHCTAQDIHQWHLNNGWSGAGYHFLVRKDGTIYRLRPENKIGAHASGSNSDSIGICFEGSYMTETMSQAQINAGKELVAYLKQRYGISKVQAHREVCSTNCPGRNFPFSEIANAKSIKNTSESNTTVNTAAKEVQYMFEAKTCKAGDCNTSVLLLQEILKARGFYSGKLDRKFGKELMIAVNKYQVERMKQGKKLGNGKGDGICGQDMWRDLIAI